MVRSQVFYANPLSGPGDFVGCVTEGPGIASFPLGALRLESALPASAGQAANFVTWLGQPVPRHFRMTWRFEVVRGPGLAMLFFGTRGCNGEDAFAGQLRPRDGTYDCYRYGDIETHHLSYYRRALDEERALRTVNLRRSPGFVLLAQGADPMADVTDAPADGYQLELVVSAAGVTFSVGELLVLDWSAPDEAWAPAGGGYVGFRQVAPLIAQYRDVVVRAISG